VLAKPPGHAVGGEDSGLDSGSEQGQHPDAGDPSHGLKAQLVAAATTVGPPDPDWRDWSSPTGHARYLVALQAVLATGPGTLSTTGFAAAVNAFVPGPLN
jgi:hypothetical protein